MSIPESVLEILEPLVQSSEGLRLAAYQDTAGIWTIGYGHTGHGVGSGLVWSAEQAVVALQQDLSAAYSQLVQVETSIPSVSSARQAAITDFVYNLGIGTYLHSTLKLAVQAGDWIRVKEQLALWVHSGGKTLQGLVTRRNKEIQLIDQ